MNPNFPQFYDPSTLPEAKGATGGVVLAHEMGQLVFGFTDPANVALVENTVRQWLNIPLRQTYNGVPVPPKSYYDERRASEVIFSARWGRRVTDRESIREYATRILGQIEDLLKRPATNRPTTPEDY